MPPSTPSYNLFDEPWIPVRWNADAHAPLPDAVGLRELLLRSHEITHIAVALPPALSGLYRILYAITARITGLDEQGPGDWAERRYDLVEQRQLDTGTIEDFVQANHRRFDLFDPEHPFLQDPRLARQCDPQNTAGVNKLVTTRPSGNNHAWFRHVSDPNPDLPTTREAVLHLLVWHYYGPSGRCSSRTIGTTKAANALAGPLRSTLSYHPEGDSLFETLLAGLPEPASTVRPKQDLCPWERDEPPDPLEAPPPLGGMCSDLTARSQHALLLVPDATGEHVRDAFITWAYRNKNSRAGDAYLIWQTSKEGNPYPRPADSHRALWRDLDALLLKKPSGTALPQRPKVFSTAHQVSEDLRVRALGFEQDGQAKDTQFVDASTPPVIGLAEDRQPRIAREIGKLRILGETYGARLDRAVKKAWAVYTDAPKSGDCTWSADAAARYWPAAEAEFWHRLENTDFATAAASFRALAEQVYDDVTAKALGTLRGAKACSQARTELYGGPAKAPAKVGGTRRATTPEDT
ncbi:type I-E CRISPR-associated protein Cse1/CasA [Kitasatospora sp. MAP5-34]|uniref:type I-E CRISPR-associated protein Cse1/CasA n=1 Tax=Kitasatospora sp. MAP5-34 TaxID=3035102 RepID=UPI0024771E38|nr:type I-E CRISPR-associated protein Cse1/CasA [Kitasatospora sp. MAP5-34]MDH6575190.1 CRISPR system Cascade subunit CasA [Kitasatospora sp. MAP5-34]